MTSIIQDFEEDVVSFDDDNDDMADLFSFGATTESKTQNVDYKKVMESVMPIPASEGSDSEDSFLDMLEQQKQEVTVVSAESTKNGNNKNDSKAADYDDKDAQEILNWLDEDDDEDQGEEEVLFVQPPREQLPTLADLPKPNPPLPPPPEFKTLEQAVRSPKSTMEQIRSLLEKENFVVTSKVRPHLWCRVVCGKSLEETLQSSVADSFQQWEQQQSSSQPPSDPYQQRLNQWISDESSALADRMLVVPSANPQLCQNALTSILLNHYDTSKKHTPQDEDKESDSPDAEEFMDPLLPPVACTILSAGIPKVAAAVMLSRIVPTFMPILALTIKERAEAAHVLHRQFYLLACYHLPLLAHHLDRFLPNWFQGPPDGLLPQSWLISHLAGECQGTLMNPKWLLCLWDLILPSNNNSLRFFLVMAILETHSDQLLLLTGDSLKAELCRIMEFKENITDGFAIEAEDETTTTQAARSVREWYDRAQAIWEATPQSVVRVLRKVEDEAVKGALTKRQREAEERLRVKLEAETRAHQEAVEAERERKSDEARLRLTRARLVAFYRTHNPGKESNIDKIMTNYEGRYDVLDAKLKQKYGVGFNPALKPKPMNKKTNKLLSTMNQGFGSRPLPLFSKRKEDGNEFVIPKSDKREQSVVSVDASEVLPIVCWSKEANAAKFAKMERQKEKRLDLKFYLVDSRPEATARQKGRFPTSVSLSPEALLDPDRIKQQEEIFESLRGSAHICIMGEGYSALPGLYGHKMTQRLYEYIKEDETRNTLCALFFIKKGFPFVSIMEGGFAAAHSWLCRDGPSNHLRVSNVLTDYHPEVSLYAQFERLYQEKEQLANATAQEKTQRALQNLFDSSMTALTKNSMRFGNLASELETADGRQKVRQSVVSNLFGSSDDSTSNSKRNSKGTSKGANGEEVTKTAVDSGESLKPSQVPSPTASGAFLNPFARKPQAPKDGAPVLSKQPSDKSLEVESVDFENSQHGSENGQTNKPLPPRPATNTFAIFKAGSSSGAKDARAEPSRVEQTAAPEPPKANPFAGLGAALNNTMKASTNKVTPSPANVLARNPFARFGINANVKKNPPAVKKPDMKPFVMPNNFAGLNQFRKHTMAKMRSGGLDEVEEVRPSAGVKDVVEESISLDQSSPAISASPEVEEHNESVDDGKEEATASAEVAGVTEKPNDTDTTESAEK